MKSHLKKQLLVGIALSIGAVILATAVLVLAGLCDHVGSSDIALVLGSKVESDGTPSPRLRARLDRTLELYRAGYFPLVVASGGTGPEGYDEATVMRDYLVTHGIPIDRIIMDSLGATTFLSARNTLAIARQRKLSSVFVVSQYFHLPRARLALTKFGISTVYSAHARYFEARDVYSSLREPAGFPSYLFRHYDHMAASLADPAK